MYVPSLPFDDFANCLGKGKSHIALNPSRMCLTCGQNGLFVELDLKTYECSSQSTSPQRNRLKSEKSALLLKILLPKNGHFALFAFLRVFSIVYEKLPP